MMRFEFAVGSALALRFELFVRIPQQESNVNNTNAVGGVWGIPFDIFTSVRHEYDARAGYPCIVVNTAQEHSNKHFEGER